MPLLSQDFFLRRTVALYVPWKFVCYSLGRLILVRAEFLSERRLIGLRLEGLSLRTTQCFVLELRPASAFWRFCLWQVS